MRKLASEKGNKKKELKHKEFLQWRADEMRCGVLLDIAPIQSVSPKHYFILLIYIKQTDKDARMIWGNLRVVELLKRAKKALQLLQLHLHLVTRAAPDPRVSVVLRRCHPKSEIWWAEEVRRLVVWITSSPWPPNILFLFIFKNSWTSQLHGQFKLKELNKMVHLV